MNSFEFVREFIVPSDVCDQTDWQLFDAGKDGNERFVLWSGVIERDIFVIQTAHVPKQLAFEENGLGVYVGADELHRLNVWLYTHNELLGIQVHSHPTDAFHSETDDCFPMVTTLGGLSLVVPYFGEFGVRGRDTALYRLSRSGWVALSEFESRRILLMEN
ncbi:MAG: hypothetical protein OXG24_01600 [Gammaproteobacteria bacterium]|nr:hypothetical protein [Gammaproteobacteria bacterium]